MGLYGHSGRFDRAIGAGIGLVAGFYYTSQPDLSDAFAAGFAGDAAKAVVAVYGHRGVSSSALAGSVVHADR